jgi:hypothetical protein
MTDRRTIARPRLPHHNLLAYEVALDLLSAVRAAEIRDAKLRDQAMRAALRVRAAIRAKVGL